MKNKYSKWVQFLIATSVLACSGLQTYGQFTRGVGGAVYALAVDTNGNVYAGGDFQTAGNISAANVAVWNPSNLVWSPLYNAPPPWNGNGVAGTVNAIAIGSDGKVYVGGQFGYNIDVWDPATTNWDDMDSGVYIPNGVPGAGGTVRGIAVAGNMVYVVGDFSHAGPYYTGIAVTNIAVWNSASNTWSAVTPLPSAIGTPLNTIVTPDGTNFFVGGPKGVAYGVSTGGDITWLVLDGNFVGNVDAIALTPDGRLFIGGTGFGGDLSIGYLAYDSLAEWNGTNAFVHVPGWPANLNVNAFSILNNELLVGGTFILPCPRPPDNPTVWALNVAQFNLTNNTWSSFGPPSAWGVLTGAGGEGGQVNALAVENAPPGSMPFVYLGFEGAVAGDYAQGQVFDGWTVNNNQVSVVNDPTNAPAGSQSFLALANGSISCTLPTVAGWTYNLNFAYRGPGIVGFWRGENNANDSISTNNGSVQNVNYTNGVVGQAFAFNSAGRIAIADQPVFQLTQSLSIEGWVRPRGNGEAILWRGDNRGGYDPYVLSMQNNTTIAFQISDSANNPASVSATLGYNQWWHVAGTLDGNTGVMSLYTNGVLASQFTTTIRPFGNLISTDSPGVGIGNVNDGRNNFPYIGDIDEISLYSRALSASEVKAIYSASSAGKFDTNASSIAQGLAEAQVTVGGDNTNVFFGNNTAWQTYTITFAAAQSNTVLQVTGIEPGMLLGKFLLTGINSSNVYVGGEFPANVYVGGFFYTVGTNQCAPYIAAWNSTNNVWSILGSNALPTVSITAPADGTTNTTPANITINATAADDCSVIEVDFYQSNALLSTVSTPPYSFNWTNVPSGTYSLTAVATDNDGATNTSSVVTVTVVTNTVLNPPPTVIRITTASFQGTNFVFSGTSDATGGNYSVLSSTNVALPITNWMTNSTGTFDASGGFNVTIPISIDTPQKFFRLCVP